MIDDKYIELLKWHNSLEFFDYNSAVDWAIKMIENGIETENILIIASFSKPVDRNEIKPYVSEVLSELGHEVKHEQHSLISITHYHLVQILDNTEIRKNLAAVYKLCIQFDFDERINNFYLLYHAWSSLEEIGLNFYYKGATLENIEQILKEEVSNWISKNIHNK